MKKRIFNRLIKRSNTNERKWDLEYIRANYNINSDKFINASIADMDFLSPKPIQKALIKRAKLGTYSYTFVNQEALLAIVNWYKNNHKINIKQSQVKIVHGTVNAMHQIVQAVTNPLDNVLIQTPVYKPIAQSILNNNRCIVENKLLFDIKTKDYLIDFEDLEFQLCNKNIKLFMLCHPHNPSNRLWTKGEITKMLDLCHKYNVIVFSDEVHADMYFENEFYSSLNYSHKNNLIVANSPNKCFNLGGLKTSYLIVFNGKLMQLIDNRYKTNSITTPNIFGLTALIAAYKNTKCLTWLKNVKLYWQENYHILASKLGSINNLIISRYNSSFLVWINHSALMTSEAFSKKCLDHNLIVSFSSDFYGPAEGWFRLNIGCSRKQLINITNILLKIFN